MSRVLYNTYCPRCRDNGKDSRGDNFSIYEDGGGHCWACHYHVFPKHVKPSHETIRKQDKALLPYDWTREVPAAAWKWLLQWGLSLAYWKEAIGYSPSQQRLIFRVGDTTCVNNVLTRNGENLAFSLGRFIPQEVRSDAVPQAVSDHPLQRRWGLPVQRAKGPTKWLSYGDCHRHAEIVAGCSVGSQADQGSPVILVEDLLSAHKVAAAGYTSVPLFGTKVHPPVLYYLLQQQRPVVLWLDKDQEGSVKREAIHLQGIINNPVNIVVTAKDPKELSLDTIKEIING